MTKFMEATVRTVGAVLAAVGLAAASLVAQTAKLPPGSMYGADPSYKVPRTIDGKPDLQGVWSNNSVTPMIAATGVLAVNSATATEATTMQTAPTIRQRNSITLMSHAMIPAMIV